jgi:hypothetical protein
VVSSQGTWRPFCVHFSDAFLDIKLNVDLLISGQFNNGDSEFFIFAYIGKICNWLNGSFLLLFVVHAAKNWLNIEGGDFPDLLIGIFDVEDEILFAPSAILNFLD